MSTRPQLPSAEYAGETDSSSQQIQELRAKIRNLERRNDELEADLQAARSDARQAQAPLRAVRRILDPLHRALKALYGEMDASGMEEETAGGTTGQPIPSSRYDAWKQRLSLTCGKVIDALLVQPQNNTQLKSFCKLGGTSVYEALKTLQVNKLVRRAGDKWELIP